MGGQQSAQAVEADGDDGDVRADRVRADDDVRADDVRDFLELHCELSPDNHVALNELTGALHVFLISRQYEYKKMLWTRELIDLFVNGYGFEFSGVNGQSRWCHVSVCGLRIKRFPRKGVAPQRNEAEYVCKLYNFLHDCHPTIFNDEEVFLENYELKRATSGRTTVASPEQYAHL